MEEVRHCQSCGREISQRTVECEHCGAVQQPPKTVKYGVMIGLGVAGVAVVAVAVAALV
jgi:predicted nucleic acid-binding Zn ribbon protein